MFFFVVFVPYVKQLNYSELKEKVNNKRERSTLKTIIK